MDSWASTPSSKKAVEPSSAASGQKPFCTGAWSSERGKGKNKGKGNGSCTAPEQKTIRYDTLRRSGFQAVEHLSQCNARLALQTARIAGLLYAQAVIIIFVPTCPLTDALGMVSEDPTDATLDHVQRWGDMILTNLEEPNIPEDIECQFRRHAQSSSQKIELLPYILV